MDIYSIYSPNNTKNIYLRHYGVTYVYMLIYQHAYSWKSYAVYNIGLSAIMGFVFTPLLVKLGLIQFFQWPYINAFMVLSFIGFLVKAATSLIFSFENQYQASQQPPQTSVLLQPTMKPLNETKENQDVDKS